MSTLHHVRDLIETFLSTLEKDGAEVGDGVRLRVPAGMTIAVERTPEPAQAVLAFTPPIELSARRGPFHLRCTLTGVSIGPNEIRLAIDGWFDRRWPVRS